jgi:glycosyltransferase involved in cell wall biosynthesis
LWDGIPTILLDAAAGDLPIVASHSGGIAEVVDNNTGWLIGEVNDAAAYAAALTFIHDHPGETEKRTVAMRELLKRQHSWNSYLSALMPIHDQRGVAPHE